MRETRELAQAIADLQPLPVEEIACFLAAGRVMAQDLRASAPWPSFSRSTRDGFALRAADTSSAHPSRPCELVCCGENLLNARTSGCLKPGESWRVVTGSLLPDGADAVVMQEDVFFEEAWGRKIVRIAQPVARGSCILAQGADIKKGELLLPRGTRLGPQALALLSEFSPVVSVHRRPSVGILAVGDEFLSQNRGGAEKPCPSNALLLETLVSAAGGVPLNLGLAPDNFADLSARLEDILGSGGCDVLVLFGGSSRGPRDCTGEAIAALPACRLLACDQKVSSGRPLSLARCGSTSLWGLPGHAASLALTAQIFLVAMLRRLEGLAVFDDRVSTACLACTLPARESRAHYAVALSTRAGLRVATPFEGGSGRISALRDMAGWVTVEASSEGLMAGTTVPVRLFL